MNELIELQDELNICMKGHCNQCKYFNQLCTDSLIDRCAEVIGELIKNGRKNNILGSTIDRSDS